MSSNIPIYTVSEQGLKSVVGGGDLRVVKEIEANRRAFRFDAEEVGELLSKWDIAKALLGTPPGYRALKNIVLGRNTTRPHPVFYLDVYEVLCRRYSYDYFEEWIQVVRGAEYFGAMDDLRKEVGLSLDFLKLVFGGPLIDIPTMPADYADAGSCGHWDRNDIEKYWAELDSYMTGEQYRDDERRWLKLNDPLKFVHQLLSTARRHDDAVIVAFFF